MRHRHAANERHADVSQSLPAAAMSGPTSRACCLELRRASGLKCASLSARSIIVSVYGRPVVGFMVLSTITPAMSLNKLSCCTARSLSETCTRSNGCKWVMDKGGGLTWKTRGRGEEGAEGGRRGGGKVGMWV